MARRLVLALMATVLIAGTQTAWAAESCDSLKKERDKVKKALEKMEAQKLPEDRLEELDNILGQILDLLNSNVKDQGDITEKIEKLEKKLPKSDSATLEKINEFVKNVKGGLKESTTKQKDAAEFLSKLRARINTIKAFYEAGDQSKAQAQIDRFGDFFDALVGIVPGVKQIPGLKDLFDAYSKSIHGIAKSAGVLDAIVARDNQLYREAGFEGDLYVRGRTPREIHADGIRKLSDKLAELERKISDGQCDKPPDQPDPCTDPKSRVVQDIKALRAKLDAERKFQQKQDDAIAGNAWNDVWAAAAEVKKATTPAQKAEAQQRLKNAKQAYADAAAARKAHTEAYEKQVGALMDLASKSEKWTPEEEKAFEDCFPYEAKLRERVRLRPKNTPPPDEVKEPAPKPAPKPAPAPKAAVKTATPVAPGPVVVRGGINCDCANTEAPNIGGAAVRQCRRSEDSLKAMAVKGELKLEVANGKIASGSNVCDGVTAGPGAWPVVGAKAKSPY